MNEMSKLITEVFKDVRTVEINGERWFVGKDACAILGDTHSSRSLSRLNDNDKKIIKIPTPRSGMQDAIVINETGLYSLILRCQTEKAKELQEKIAEVASSGSSNSQVNEIVRGEYASDSGFTFFTRDSDDKEVQGFFTGQFGENLSIILRDKDGEVWFIGSEVAETLEYVDPDKAIRQHVFDSQKQRVKLPANLVGYSGLSGTPLRLVISETGVYALTLRSKMKEAQKFTEWVTEVVKSIRKHGAYAMPDVLQKAIEDKDYCDELLDTIDVGNKYKNVITKATAAVDNEYHDWCRYYVNRGIDCMLSLKPGMTNTEVLSNVYRRMKTNHDVDVNEVQFDFMLGQLMQAKKVGLKNLTYEELKVPILYAIYADDYSKWVFEREMHDMAATEYRRIYGHDYEPSDQRGDKE